MITVVVYHQEVYLNTIQTADIDVQTGDALLTLTTCLGDDRLVVVARRLREDEPASTDRQEGQT